ncbi:MAG: hypothetical protein KDC38_08450 [Planctomycetes bacterium]|nr:hypothetical protein [Planctomycetota bacterium]
MRRLCTLFLVVAVPALSGAQTLPVPTTLIDFFQPGTQPLAMVDPVIGGTGCTTCHAGFDPETAPFDHWQVSIMAQAMRDPLFHACLAVANQDAQFVGDLCLRCHSPIGWLDGNSTPTDGSAISGVSEYDGVTCHFCHRMVDPVYQPGVSPPDDFGILNGLLDPVTDSHSGQYVVDPQDRRRGPFDLVPGFAFHEWRKSPYHSESRMCGTCHDVSNPVFEKVGNDYVPTDLDQPHPTHDRYQEFPIERTYSEWLQSAFATGPIDMGGRFGGNQSAVSTCQDCHMPRTTGYACTFSGSSVFRTNLPQHDFNGSHTWVLDAIDNLDFTMEIYQDPAYMNPVQLAAAKDRNISMLERASDLELTQTGADLQVRVINQTGHKLPSGYPEGRRVWVNVRFLDAGGALVREHGHYDSTTADLTTTDTKVYETHLGLDATMAGVTGLPEGPSFHFALNNKTYKDNRIPPRGFTNAGFASVQAAPVGYSYPDGQYWDDTAFPIPTDATQAEVTIYYQTASKEYITFLRDANTTNNAGDVLHAQWELLGKGPPVVMDNATIAFTDAEFVRSDCNQDGGFDVSDPVALLGVLFTLAPTPTCLDACDVNDDAALDISDPVYSLAALFSAGALPTAPYPNCGPDPTSPDGLSCLESTCP